MPESHILNFLLGIIAIGQIIAGVFAWYCGLQVKMLRLELVSKKECEAYRDRAREETNAMHTCVSTCKADISEIASAMQRLHGGEEKRA